MNSCFLGIGSNKGDRFGNISKAISLLGQNLNATPTTSSISEFPALLKPNSPKEWNIPFLNCVVHVETNLHFLELFYEIKEIEKEMGRDFNTEVWSPRIIDIDILFYNNLVYNTAQLQIPHTQIQYRDFVLKPLCEIAENYVHPITHTTCGDMLRKLIARQ